MGVPLDHGSQMTSASKRKPTRSDRRGGPLTVLLALLLIASPALADRTIEGRVTVVRDVDTIIGAGTAVRLNGVDGPETSTRYGREARAFMTRPPCAPNLGSSYDVEMNGRERDGYF